MILLRASMRVPNFSWLLDEGQIQFRGGGGLCTPTIILVAYAMRLRLRSSKESGTTLFRQCLLAGGSVLRSAALALGPENWLDLQVPRERLVEEDSGLDRRHDGRPRQRRNRSEEHETHHVVVGVGECLDGAPYRVSLDVGPDRLRNLQ